MYFPLADGAFQCLPASEQAGVSAGPPPTGIILKTPGKGRAELEEGGMLEPTALSGVPEGLFPGCASVC